MTQTSYRGYVDRIDPESFITAQPVSAGRAFLLRNNLLHLADEYTQTRINWCAGISGSYGVLGGFWNYNQISGAAGDYSVYEQEFAHTWLGDSHPANLDLHIRSGIVADSGSPEMDVRVRVVPAFYDPGNLILPAIVDETHTVTDNAGDWDHQEIFDTEDAALMNRLRALYKFEVSEDSEWHYPQVSILKLQVQLLYVSGNADVRMKLHGVQLREFA